MAVISVSGTAYSDFGTTPLGAGLAVYVSVNGGAPTINTTTASDGTFTLSGITSSSTPLTVFLKGNTQKGATILLGQVTNITGIALYQDTLLIEKVSNSSSITMNSVTLCDNSGDADIAAIFTSTATTNLTTADGKHLYIRAGNTSVINFASLAVSVGGNFFHGSTSTMPTTGTLTFAGNGSYTFTNSGGAALLCAVVVSSVTTLTLGANLGASGGSAPTSITINSGGTLDVSASNFAVFCNGNWTNNGTFTARQGTVNISTTATIDPGGSSFYNLATAGVGKTYTLSGHALTITNNFTMSTGGETLDCNGQDATFSTIVSVPGNAAIQCKTGTVTFNGGLTLGSSAGVLTGSSGTININGTLTISNGTLTASSGTTNVSGNFTHTSGTFTHNSGTVVLNGTNQTVGGATNTTFFNLTKTVASADTLTFTAGKTQTVNNALTLTGAAGQLLSLVSSSPGSTWTLGVPATQTLSYLSVTDGVATGNTAAAGSTSSGSNTTNWTFGTVGYTLSAASGSFTVTGAAAGLGAARALVSTAGAFVLSGQSAGIGSARAIVSGLGAFAVTGQSAGIATTRSVAAGSGAFSLVGQGAGLVAARSIVPSAGAFVLTGQGAGLSRGAVVGATPGAFVLTGQAVSLYHGITVSTGVGAFALAGQSVSMSVTRRLAAGTGQFIVVGIDASLAAFRVLYVGGAFTADASGTFTGTATGTFIGTLAGTFSSQR